MNLSEMDIVYFVKESATNEELRYSLRSVDKNFPHRHVWFIGGKPFGLNPDRWIHLVQNQSTKWDNTSMLFKTACKTPEISEDFVLFNDDFFVMKPVNCMPYYSDGTIARRVQQLQKKYNKDSSYSKRLTDTIRLLESAGFPTISYAVHYPIIINKKEMLETFERFPSGLMWRSIYGNHHKKPVVTVKDCKINEVNRTPSSEAVFLSTQDATFKSGIAGRYIRANFPDKCKYETQN